MQGMHSLFANLDNCSTPEVAVIISISLFLSLFVDAGATANVFLLKGQQFLVFDVRFAQVSHQTNLDDNIACNRAISAKFVQNLNSIPRSRQKHAANPRLVVPSYGASVDHQFDEVVFAQTTATVDQRSEEHILHHIDVLRAIILG